MSENELQVIDERELFGKEFRIYGTAENPLFLAKQIAELIDYSFKDSRKIHRDVSKMLSSVDEEEKLKSTLKLGGEDCSHGGIRKNTEMWFLTEDGLYEVLMQSRKPIAKQFKKEVKNILKTIRKHGAYMTENTIEKALTDPDFLIQLATQLKEEREQKKKLEATIEEQKPLVSFANTVTESSDCLDIGEFAKVIKGEDIKMGRNKLFQWLRNNKYLMDNNVPYQKYIDNGLFKVIEVTKKSAYDDGRIYTKTLVTGKGQIYILEKLKEECA